MVLSKSFGCFWCVYCVFVYQLAYKVASGCRLQQLMEETRISHSDRWIVSISKCVCNVQVFLVIFLNWHCMLRCNNTKWCSNILTEQCHCSVEVVFFLFILIYQLILILTCCFHLKSILVNIAIICYSAQWHLWVFLRYKLQLHVNVNEMLYIT